MKKNFAGKEEEKYEIQRLAMALVAVCTVLFLASVAMGQYLLCVSEPHEKGGKTVAACNAAGSKFAFIPTSGIAHILTKEEMDLTIANKPKLGRMQA